MSSPQDSKPNLFQGAMPSRQSPSQWWYAVNGQKLGPFSQAEITQRVGRGEVALDDLVWSAGMDAWIPMSESALSLLLPDQNLLDTIPALGLGPKASPDEVKEALEASQHIAKLSRLDESRLRAYHSAAESHAQLVKHWSKRQRPGGLISIPKALGLGLLTCGVSLVWMFGSTARDLEAWAGDTEHFRLGFVPYVLFMTAAVATSAIGLSLFFLPLVFISGWLALSESLISRRAVRALGGLPKLHRAGLHKALWLLGHVALACFYAAPFGVLVLLYQARLWMADYNKLFQKLSKGEAQAAAHSS